MRVPYRSVCPALAALCLLLATAGCSTDTFLNQTASLGGDTAGENGNLNVLFINNTPFRAIFTYGTYNNTDQFDEPDTGQFVGAIDGAVLEGGTAADILTITCDRVFAVGDPEMLKLIEQNGQDTEELDPEALTENIAFSGAALGEENAGVATEGFAPYLRALLGVDFPCGSILVIRFEETDVGEPPFRADFEVIPPGPGEDDRGT